MSMEVDEELRALIEGGCAIVIGTRDAHLSPEIARGWGARLLPDRRTIEVCIGLPSGRRTLSNLADNGQIAVTCVRPSDYRQVQIKSGDVETLDPTPDDRAWVERHRDAFRREVAEVGIAAELCHGFWSHDVPAALVKLRIVLAHAFDQTPGPDAGRPL